MTTELMHLKYAKTEFECPHCGNRYNDDEDEYLHKMESSLEGIARVRCDCGNEFGVAYDMCSQIHAFTVDPETQQPPYTPTSTVWFNPPDLYRYCELTGSTDHYEAFHICFHATYLEF